MSPSITKADVAMLGRRAIQPVKEPGDLLAVFVAGNLVNTKNARLHWRDESRYKRSWRERVALGVLEANWSRERTRLCKGPLPGIPGNRCPWDHIPYLPKSITLACNMFHLMDSVDGLRVACAPITDALKQCGVIDDDRDSSKHEFAFTQQIDRKHRGVTIRVRLAP